MSTTIHLDEVVRLLAVELLDGLLFFEQGGSIFSMRPPYEQATPVFPIAVQHAVYLHGFQQRSQVFRSKTSMLTSFAKEVAVARATKKGERLLEWDDAAATLLSVAPESILWHFVRRVREELLPKEKYGQAMQVLEAMFINSPLLVEDSLLRRQVILLHETARRFLKK